MNDDVGPRLLGAVSAHIQSHAPRTDGRILQRAGLKRVHVGHQTIAQDRPTSAVYGMPGAAAELQAVSEVLALDKIGPRLTNIVTQKMKVHG